MRYEDLERPAYLLNRGVEKLLKYGMPTFELYADEVRLSYCDRNRVIAKCKILKPDSGFKEIECPKNLRGERWNYYTKAMRYSDEAARDIISRIGKSFESQFVPIEKNLGNLTKGIGNVN